jgi:hypothetical protein
MVHPSSAGHDKNHQITASGNAITGQLTFSAECRRLTFWDQATHDEILLGDDMLVFRSEGVFDASGNFGDLYPDKRWKPARQKYRYGDRTSRNWFYFRQKDIEGYIVRSIARAWDLDLESTLDCLTVYYTSEDTVPVQLANGSGEDIITVEWCVQRPR